MSPDITLAAIVIIPVILLMFFRINAALVFMSLCLGYVLAQFVASDANSLINLIGSNALTDAEYSTDENIKIALLLFPTILTAVFMIRTVRDKGRLALNLLPAIGVGLLGALMIVPLLPPGLAHNVVASELWDQVIKAQVLIVGSSALVCLLVLWMQRPKTGGGKHDKKKH